MCSQTDTTSPNVSVARVFFKTSVIGKEANRIHDTSFQNVMKCDVDIRVNLYANVVLPSSTTMFQEISERMTKEADGIGSIRDVLSCASLSSVFFSGLLRSRCIFSFFPCHCRTATPCHLSSHITLHRAQKSHIFLRSKPKSYQKHKNVPCKCDNFVPIVVPGLSSEADLTSSAEDSAETTKESTLDDQETTKASRHRLQDLPEWLQEFTENLV